MLKITDIGPCFTELFKNNNTGTAFFTRESSYCFQRVLAIAILSVCPSVRPSVRHTGGSVKNGAS